MKRLAALILAALVSYGAGAATFSWTPPTTYNDGSPILSGELLSHVLYCGNQGGPYSILAEVPMPATSAVLTENGTHCVATARTDRLADGSLEESVFSNEVQVAQAGQPPDQVTGAQVTFQPIQEPPPSMPIVEGTPVTTPSPGDAASITINLPDNMANGELVVITHIVFDSSRPLADPGSPAWSLGFNANLGGTLTLGVIARVIDGTEGYPATGATQSFAYTGGTSNAQAVAYRVSGVDTADPFNTNNRVIQREAVNVDPLVIAANTLTGVLADSILGFFFGNDAGSRSIVSGDADLTLLASINAAPIHSLYEAAPGSGNAEYSIDMSASLRYSWGLFEIKAAAGGTTFFQTVPATATGVASVADIITYTLALSSVAVGTALLTRINTFLRALSATAVGAPVLARVSTFLRTLATTATGISTLATAILKTVSMAATAAGVAVLSSVFTAVKTLAATAIGVSVLSTISTFARALAASAVGIAGLSRVSTFARSLDVIAIGITTLSTTFTKILAMAVTAVGVAVLTPAQLILKSLAATAVGIAMLSTALIANITMAASSAGVAALSRIVTYARTIAGAAVGLAMLTKGMFVTLGATAIGVIEVNTISSYFRNLGATAIGIAILTPAQLILKSLAVVAVGVASLSETLLTLVTMAVTSIGVATLTKILTIVKTLAAVATGVPALSKKMFVTMAAIALGVVAFPKQMFKTLAVAVSAIPTMTKALLASVTIQAVANNVATLANQFIEGVGTVVKLLGTSYSYLRGFADMVLLPVPAYVDARILAANVAESVTPPAGAARVNFSATGNFYAKFNGTAAVPSEDITDGSASMLNPKDIYLQADTISTISIVAPAATTVTLTYYS